VRLVLRAANSNPLSILSLAANFDVFLFAESTYYLVGL
jgi:hypothetical protein